MNNRKMPRESIPSKKNKHPQRMSRDASAPPVDETAAAPAPFSYQELREINFQISASWFRAPEITHLTLMEVHPWQLHAHWNIAAADMAAARASLPADAEEPSLILRFTDLSARQSENTSEQHFDIEVQGLTNSWYVDLWQDGRRYSAQLGLRTIDGDLIPLASSNEVALPCASPSRELDFKQLEVRSPLPLDISLDRNIPETASVNGDHLLQNLFPGCSPQDEIFPEFESEVSDTRQLDEPECPALMRVIDALADCPEPFKTELELIDYPHTFRPPSLTENTEFPRIENKEITPYSMQAKTEKARLLAKIKMELPPMAKETVSPADMDLTPQPFLLFKNESGLPHSKFNEPLVEPSTQAAGPNTSKTQYPKESGLPRSKFNEPLVEPSTQAGGPDTSKTQYPKDSGLPRSKFNEPLVEPSTQAGGPDTSKTQHPGTRPDLLQKGFPEVMPDRGTDFAEHELPVPIAETGEQQNELEPFTFHDKENMAANTSQAHRSMVGEAASEQPTAPSRTAPRPVIALEELLSNGIFSYGRGKSGLEATAELHLHGRLESDSVLSLFGEQVHVDDQGNFSVRLKLDRGPALSTLLYGQRKRSEDHR